MLEAAVLLQSLPDLGYLRKEPLWSKLSPEDKLKVLELGSCELSNKEAAGLCFDKWLTRKMYGAVLDPHKVVAAVGAALKRLV
jgi:hypothetical protein